jgi:aspartate ammonia-lyase
MRTESDFLGSLDIEENALYGIHSKRAAMNFPDRTALHQEWYRALGTVKKACYLTYRNFADAVRRKYKDSAPAQALIKEAYVEALIRAADEMESGEHYDHYIVPAIQGGAGTSINMNINEIIANRALQILGQKTGAYDIIDPVEHSNIYQSTNDVVPTSLKVCLLSLLAGLEDSINTLRSGIELQEQKTQKDMRISYTQMQEAVPSTYGNLFSTYNDALSRDWWRVSKCAERIRVVNLGGSAIGTGIAVPRFFLQEVVRTLRKITHLPVSQAENLQDATANLDVFVEVHAILKAHAVNLEKMANDLRLLSSELIRDAEVSIPKLQPGSSVMPGKVNPVVPEFVISAAHKVYSNDMLITGLCGQGCLDLNPYLPVIGHAAIESIKLLIACDETLGGNLVKGLVVHEERSKEHLLHSAALTTALLPYVGYHKATLLATEMKRQGISILEANERLGLVDHDRLLNIISPANLLKKGYTLSDTLNNAHADPHNVSPSGKRKKSADSQRKESHNDHASKREGN